MYRSALTSTSRAFAAPSIYTRSIHFSPVAAKSVTEKVSEVADAVNKKVGKGLASAIETGEKVTSTAEEKLGKSCSQGSTKEEAKKSTDSLKNQVGSTAESAKRTAQETAEQAKQKANQTSAGAREAKDNMKNQLPKSPPANGPKRVHFRGTFKLVRSESPISSDSVLFSNRAGRGEK
ncbi:hypothetical protein BJ138DRAFT_1097173 [Hygrophoropsis aurantiaca]|uniref:Uncharacterized protein n=1 Tax=Hygrophoropsis aurantiaca TaxID=72124 RepID=A0ACB8ATC8_9AGAM|nr:hypothetical protein BJ138DRAFT_1097173 [Hygrophoropsis aurantiaca]